jgi:uncharacterized lipoprotein YmbA
MERISTGFGLLVMTMSLFLMTGCGTTPPTKFYLLTPDEQLQSTAGGAAMPELVIGIGPMRLSDYLGRPQIVARENINRLQIEEFERWGGSLGTNVSWVMAENLSILLGTDSVLIHPWERAIQPHFQVAVDIRRLDAGEDNQLNLVALWRVLRDDGRDILTIRRSVIQEPLPDANIDSLVKAQSRALARLSEEIAREIRALHSARK